MTGLVAEEIQVESAPGVTLAGDLTLPDGRRAAPVVIAAHGASSGTRDSPLLQHLAQVLPRAGIGTLVFDRRGEGESSGSHKTATLDDLVGDVASWIRMLRRDSRVDGIGLWGISQAGWILPQAAVREHATCLVAVSPSGVSPRAQMRYAVETVVRDAGFSKADVRRAVELRTAYDDAVTDPARRPSTRAQVDAARNESWFDLTYVGDPESEWVDAYAEWVDFDISPTLRSLRCPVLLVFGERDRWVPIEESLRIWRESLATDVPLTVVRPRGTGHSPTFAADPVDPMEDGPISPEYERALVDWLRAQLLP